MSGVIRFGRLFLFSPQILKTWQTHHLEFMEMLN